MHVRLMHVTRLHDLASIWLNPDHVSKVEVAFESETHAEVWYLYPNHPDHSVRVVESPDEVAAEWAAAKGSYDP